MPSTEARRRAPRIAAALVAVAIVGIAGPASAHIHVDSDDAARGAESAKVVFRVPTESDTASTTKVVVTLPQDTPFAYVSAESKPGWKVDVVEAKLDKPVKAGSFTLTEAARTVTWTSIGDGIPPSQFDEFALSVGPLPDVGKIVFTADQTYSDGSVVSWNEIQKGDKEPEHPAPTLALTAATAEGDHHDGTTPGTVDDSGSGVAPWLSGGALVVAVAALVVSLRQNRRRA